MSFHTAVFAYPLTKSLRFPNLDLDLARALSAVKDIVRTHFNDNRDSPLFLGTSTVGIALTPKCPRFTYERRKIGRPTDTVWVTINLPASEALAGSIAGALKDTDFHPVCTDARNYIAWRYPKQKPGTSWGLLHHVPLEAADGPGNETILRVQGHMVTFGVLEEDFFALQQAARAPTPAAAERILARRMEDTQAAPELQAQLAHIRSEVKAFNDLVKADLERQARILVKRQRVDMSTLQGT